MSTTLNPNAMQRDVVLRRDMGLTGRVAVTWSVAGGLVVGGFLVAGMTLGGKLSGNALLMTAGALYVIGALLGFVHGAVLGFLGRPEHMTRREAAGQLALAALYAVPAVTVGFVAAGWIAMTVVALYLDRTLPLVGSAAGWLVGLVLVTGAARYGWRALANAYARWPERRLGTVLFAATFSALLILFLADRPELWGVRLRVTEVGAVLLAATSAFWVAGPLLTLGLHLRRLIRGAGPISFGAPAPRALTNVFIGLAAGVMLGVVAVPFQTAAFTSVTATGPAGNVVLMVSRALVDEVLLRLFLVTAATWTLLRWLALPAPHAAVAAVLVAALVQVLMNVPGVREIGFATTFAASAYVAVAVLLPALVFGLLFWKRGFMTALVADASALFAAALLV
jgi:hypothetical protein